MTVQSDYPVMAPLRAVGLPMSTGAEIVVLTANRQGHVQMLQSDESYAQLL